MHLPPGYEHEQRSQVAPASAELQPSFEPVPMGAVAASQNRSALPPGEASKVSRILLHQLQSPEREDTSHVEGVSPISCGFGHTKLCIAWCTESQSSAP